MKSSWWLLALVLGAVIPAAAGDWPQWRGPDRDGISRETGWRSDWGAEDRPKILWEAKVGIGFSSFAVSEGRVFTLGNDSDTDTLWCFEAATGKVLWAHHYPMPLDALYFEGGPVSTPVVEGGRVFAIGKRGLVHCLNAADGSVVWSTQIAEGEGLAHAHLGFLGIPGRAGGPGAHQRGRLWIGVAESGWLTPLAFRRGLRSRLFLTVASGH
ncbi:MAG: PQQ-binding-like beta-propeller repeat protein [Verrucomicrobiales bacterium]